MRDENKPNNCDWITSFVASGRRLERALQAPTFTGGGLLYSKLEEYITERLQTETSFLTHQL